MFALILAGGKGERLRPLTDSLPKPMVPVCGKPILEHQVTWLKAGGVTDVVFLGGYRWEAIKDHFGAGKDFGINAHYSVEDSPLGRVGAIKAGFPMIPDTENTVAVLNGDVLTAETPANISAQHQERKDANESHLATIMVVPMVSPYGLVEMDDTGTVTGFLEKVDMQHRINPGIFLCERSKPDESLQLGHHATDIVPWPVAPGQILAVQPRAFWRSVDSLEDLKKADDNVGNR